MKRLLKKEKPTNNEDNIEKVWEEHVKKKKQKKLRIMKIMIIKMRIAQKK